MRPGHLSAGNPAYDGAEVCRLQCRLDLVQRENAMLRYERELARARVRELELHRCEACRRVQTDAARAFFASLREGKATP